MEANTGLLNLLLWCILAVMVPEAHFHLAACLRHFVRRLQKFSAVKFHYVSRLIKFLNAR
jgi:hypothetical protein